MEIGGFQKRNRSGGRTERWINLKWRINECCLGQLSHRVLILEEHRLLRGLNGYLICSDARESSIAGLFFKPTIQRSSDSVDKPVRNFGKSEEKIYPLVNYYDANGE